ncbi:uncharacterized protein LOC141691892 [Apium graveolens]|uniref:uncharacterized protein LOC141691892 n=1 Tax=Apium graveolens TaxID=4045 RepID=UPI003D7BA7AB
MKQFGKLDEMSLEEVVGSLKAHDEKVNGQDEKGTGQLLFIEEEWVKREGTENLRLLLTREEWLKRSNKGATESSQTWRNKNTGGVQGGRGGRDKSRVRCFNYLGYGHYAADYRKSKKEKDTKIKANLALVQDDEPALLFTKTNEGEGKALLLNEGDVVPKLIDSINTKIESNVWYLDNGASNHMTGERNKFKELDESVTGKVKFGNGSTVEIKGKGVVSCKCKNREDIALRNVYFIPILCSNIVSLGQLSDPGKKVFLSSAYI